MRLTRLLLCGAALALAGCGQKGPLYLPDKNAAVVTTPSPAQAGVATPAAQAPAPKKPAGKDDDPAAPQ